jgi:hypothetical protein
VRQGREEELGRVGEDDTCGGAWAGSCVRLIVRPPVT